MRSHEKGGEIPARALAHINGEQLAVISEICLVFCGHMEAPKQAGVPVSRYR